MKSVNRNTKIANALRKSGFPVARLQDKGYQEAREKLIFSNLDQILELRELPERFVGGGRFDERVVEYSALAWFLKSKAPIDILMDLGMTANNKAAKKAVETCVEKIRFVNPAPDDKILCNIETEIFCQGLEGFKSLPKDNTVLTSISTVEHVGYDNSQYGLTVKTKRLLPSRKPLELLASFADSVLLPTGSSLFVTFPIGKKQLNLHPVTLRFASQTFNHADVEFFISELSKRGFDTRFDTYSISGEDFVRNDRKVWKMRYGQGSVAATGVAIIRASR